jgi:hypothetical protein
MGRKAKLSQEQVEDIRKYIENPVFTNVDVQKKFNISYTLVRKIKEGQPPYDKKPIQLELPLEDTNLPSEGPAAPIY